METSNKKVMRKFVSVLLLIFLISSITASAVASSSADQSQSGQLTVTRDGICCNLDQAQIAVVDENGNIIQCELSDVHITYDKYGKIKSVTLKLKQIQKVSSTSTDPSSTAVSTSDVSSSQDANVVTTKDSASVSFNQVECSLQSSSGVIKQVQIAIVKVKFTKHGVKVIVKLKQKVKVK